MLSKLSYSFTDEAKAHEIHAYEVYAHEVRAHEVHARGVHAHEVPVCKMRVCEVHAHEVHAREMHADEVHALRGIQDIGVEKSDAGDGCVRDSISVEGFWKLLSSNTSACARCGGKPPFGNSRQRSSACRSSWVVCGWTSGRNLCAYFVDNVFGSIEVRPHACFPEIIRGSEIPSGV